MTVTNTKTNTVKALACQALKSIGSCRHCHVMQSFHLNCFISPLLHCMPDAAVVYPVISVHYTVSPFTEIVSENGTVHCDWITTYQHSDSESNPSELVKFIKLKQGCPLQLLQPTDHTTPCFLQKHAAVAQAAL